jgi:NifU-like protein involved in Fe-S cluster formation
MTGLSVRPALAHEGSAGCVTGVAASVVARQDNFDPAVASGRCIPIPTWLMPCGRQNPFSRHRVSPYIFFWAAEAIRQRWIFGRSPMLNDVYNARILDLAGNIPRLGRLPAPDATATAHSKLCGSTVTIDLKLSDGAVSDFAHDVKACALGQASSSIMARHVIGARPAELRELRETVRKMLKENGAPPVGKWADIAVLEPVRDYKARHASTMLTFDAVVSALDQIEARSAKRTHAVE